MSRNKTAFSGNTQARQALNAIGKFLFDAMYLHGDIDFHASSRRLRDGSVNVTVVHPSGTFFFQVPAEERKAAQEREHVFRRDCYLHR
jgi:hypothetical protein